MAAQGIPFTPGHLLAREAHKPGDRITSATLMGQPVVRRRLDPICANQAADGGLPAIRFNVAGMRGPSVNRESEIRDRWAQWLLERRHGGDANLRKAMLAELEIWQARVLHKARLRSGDVLLDVGSGDGLIAFAAAELIGPTGRVIFSDVSEDLLDHCRSLANELDIGGRCRFVVAGAEDLGAIEDASADVVTTRSVLIYVKEKRRALAEFYRLLKPAGRISLLEPINRLMYPEPPKELIGFDVTAIQDLAAKIKAVAEQTRKEESAMLDFDDRDLLVMAEEVGFRDIHLDLARQIVAQHMPQTWKSFLAASGNPLAPSREGLIAQALTAGERQRFEAHMRPLVESGRRTRRVDSQLTGPRVRPPSSRRSGITG